MIADKEVSCPQNQALKLFFAIKSSVDKVPNNYIYKILFSIVIGNDSIVKRRCRKAKAFNFK